MNCVNNYKRCVYVRCGLVRDVRGEVMKFCSYVDVKQWMLYVVVLFYLVYMWVQFLFFFLWHGVLKFFWSYVNVNFKTGGWNFIMWFPVNIKPVRQSRGWGTKFRKLSYFAKQMNKINKWMNKNFHPLIYENFYLRAMRFTANKKLFYLRARRDMPVPQRTMSRDHSSCEAAGFWGGKGRGGET